MAAKFGVEAAPTLLVACNGDPNTAERFEGEFKSGPISDFLSKFAGGRKCATAVQVRTNLQVYPSPWVESFLCQLPHEQQRL